MKKYFIVIIIIIMICSVNFNFSEAQAQQKLKERPFSLSPYNPQVFDPGLKVEQVVQGLEMPTTMAFVEPDDFLVLEKDKGTVMRVVGGKISEAPVLDVNVANSVERGMVGIAVSKDGPNTYVFLYYTEIDGQDGEDKKGKAPLGNRVYRYEWVDDKLVNPVLLLDLPANPGPRHNGGAIEIGPDDNIYVPIGDIDGSFKPDFRATKTQNSPNGRTVDGRSGILRITQDGQPVDRGILGDSMPLRMYYAYGIRNSFGLGFDPLNDQLWETENGPQDGDEINLIHPGFNSGWNKVYGFSTSQKKFDTDGLISFDGAGKYEEPKLVWTRGTGLTAIIFLNSDKLGDQYKNDMFVANVNSGRIYHFKLTEDRNDLLLPKALSSRYVQNPPSIAAQDIVFGDGFVSVTDLTMGPDGYLYLVSIGEGKVFRISPK